MHNAPEMARKPPSPAVSNESVARGFTRNPGPIRYATSRDGTRIAWTEQGAGPTLIYVPAWLDTIEIGRAWRYVRPVFDGRVVLYDRRGFGRSDHGVDHGLEQYADDLEAVADAAGVQDIALFGAAAGTLESVVLAARTPRVTRMLLTEPAFFRTGEGPPTSQRALMALLDQDFATFWRAFLSFAIGWGEPAAIEALVRYYLSATTPGDVRALMETLYLKADLAPYAPLVRADCLIVHNVNDPLMPPNAAVDLARLLPRQRLLMTPAARFSVDDAALREMRSFLAGESFTFEELVDGPTADSQDHGPWGRLTEREAEVLEHLVTGATNNEISTALCVTTATVARHVANIYAKLGVRNRVAATRWADDHPRNHRLGPPSG